MKKDTRGRKKIIYNVKMQKKMREALAICYDNILDLETQLDITDDYIRKMINGEKKIPSKYYDQLYFLTNRFLEKVEKVLENLGNTAD